MPVDPNIPLALLQNPPQPALKTPLETEQQMATQQFTQASADQTELENQQKQREAADQEQLKQVLQEAGGDIDLVIEKMMGINPDIAMKLREQKAKQAEQAFKTEEQRLTAFAKRLESGIQLAQSVRDDVTHQRAVAIAMSSGDAEMARLLGPTYDPDRMTQLTDAGTKLVDRNNMQQLALKNLAEGVYDQAAARAYASARTPEEWAGVGASMKILNVPKQWQDIIARQFGEFSPENLKKAQAMVAALDAKAGSTREGKESVDLNINGKKTGGWFDRAAGTYGISTAQGDQVIPNAQIWQDPKTPTAPVSEPLENVIDPVTGKAGLVPRSQVPRGAQRAPDNRPVSVDQSKSLEFYQRMRQAEEELRVIEGEIGKSTTTIGDMWRQNMPAFLNTELGNRWQTAQRAFTEARLRKDSGAAIPEYEVAADKRTNFVQPGEGEAEKAQKWRSRQNQLATSAFRAGPALAEYAGGNDEAQRIIEAHKTSAKVPGGKQEQGGGTTTAAGATPSRRSAAPEQPAAGRPYRGQLAPPQVPPDVAQRKPSNPRKFVPVKKYEGGRLYEYKVYADGSADKKVVEGGK